MSKSNSTNTAESSSQFTLYHKDFNLPDNGKQQVDVGWKTVGKRNRGRLTKLTSLSQKARKKVELKNKANDKDVEVPMEYMEPGDLLKNAAMNATGAKAFYSYNVSINYPVPEKEERFDMRQCFNKLIQELLKLDQDMIVGSTTNE
eukprot:14447808-Ditylum_brightwellii.AAC.1